MYQLNLIQRKTSFLLKKPKTYEFGNCRQCIKGMTVFIKDKVGQNSKNRFILNEKTLPPCQNSGDGMYISV
jgi:hypothetical protein